MTEVCPLDGNDRSCFPPPPPGESGASPRQEMHWRGRGRGGRGRGARNRSRSQGGGRAGNSRASSVAPPTLTDLLAGPPRPPAGARCRGSGHSRGRAAAPTLVSEMCSEVQAKDADMATAAAVAAVEARATRDLALISSYDATKASIIATIIEAGLSDCLTRLCAVPHCPMAFRSEESRLSHMTVVHPGASKAIARPIVEADPAVVAAVARVEELAASLESARASLCELRSRLAPAALHKALASPVPDNGGSRPDGSHKDLSENPAATP